MLFSLLQFLLAFLYVVFGLCNIGFNIVDFLTLGEYQSGELVEEFKALTDWCFQSFDISELVLDIRDCILQRRTSLTINFPLKHFLSQIRILYIFLSLRIINIPINKLNLPDNLLLDCCLILILITLLFLQDIGNFLTQTMVEILLHTGLRLVGEILFGFVHSIFKITDFLFYLLMHTGILFQNLIHFITAGFFLGWFDGFGVFALQVLYLVVILIEGNDHLTNCLNILKKFLIDTFIILGLIVKPTLVHPIIGANLPFNTY